MIEYRREIAIYLCILAILLLLGYYTLIDIFKNIDGR